MRAVGGFGLHLTLYALRFPYYVSRVRCPCARWVISSQSCVNTNAVLTGFPALRAYDLQRARMSLSFVAEVLCHSYANMIERLLSVWYLSFFLLSRRQQDLRGLTMSSIKGVTCFVLRESESLALDRQTGEKEPGRFPKRAL
jgi:hypothetical protein